MNEIIERFSQIIEVKNERAKLQKIYLSLAILSFFAASVVSLINRDFGRIILSGTVASILIFLANAIVWALGSAFFENFFASKKPKTTISKSKK
ncbi:MAG: hypothetical protein Q4A27_00950 [bacterium]|nr:hypothetical protein [bacterium]